MRPVHVLALTSAVVLGCARSENSEVEPTAEPASVAEPRETASVAAVTDLEAAFKGAIRRVGPAVVSIYSTKTVDLRHRGFPQRDPFFERFVPGRPGQMEQRGLGSGFVIDAEGHVLTNNHVVDGAHDIRVKLADGRELEAEVIGTDPPTDLALLKIEGRDLAPVELGESGRLEVGDWVLAIGSPFGLSQTVSAGIVSAVGRANVGILDYEDFIQTDAAVNLGNSGGPLVDLGGRVVGINTAIASAGGGSNGIAFAVPVDMAKAVVEQLRSNGKVSRGQLGIVISELTPQLAETFDYEGEGLLVQDVRKGGAADEAGMDEGDIVTALDGQPVTDVARFRNAIARTAPGKKVRLEVWRDGSTRTMQVELDAVESGAVPGRPVSTPAQLGLVLEDATPPQREHLGLGTGSAIVITRVEPGSVAAKAGIAAGDVLERIGDEHPRDADSAAKRLQSIAGPIRLRLRRGDAGRFVVLERE